MEELRIPFSGLDKDSSELNKNEGGYGYALNMVSADSSGNRGAVQNEVGNIKTHDLNDHKLVGFRYLKEYNKTLLFTTNGTTSIIALYKFGSVSEFDFQNTEYCNGCTNEFLVSYSDVPSATSEYEILIQSNDLNFSVLNPVECRYKLTDCTFNIYFRDGNNPDRYIYFDIVNDKFYLQNRFKKGYKKDCDGESYTNELNVDFTSWYQDFSVPTIETYFENGGKLREGTYQVLFAYSNSRGVPLTSYKSLTNPLPLFSEVTKVEFDLQTDKGLVIKTNVDQNVFYSYYNLVIAQTVNRVTTYKKITLPKSQLEYFFTDIVNYTQTDENEIFQQYPYYENSDYMSEANGFLFRGGLKEFAKFNLQPVANKIKLGWQTVKLKLGDYGDPHISQNYRSYLRDEVYAPGISFLLNNGDETPVYHIPGREATAFDRELVQDTSNDDPFAADKRTERWKIFNTGSTTSTSLGIYDKSNPQVYEEGEFAYWESSEKYPLNKEIWGDLCGKPIRHHKFPDNSITHIHDGKNLTIPTQNSSLFPKPEVYIFPIGFKVKSNIEVLLNQAVVDGIITQAQRNRIVGYRIVRGNRYGNKSIQAKGLLFNTRNYTKNGLSYRFPNYPFNDLRVDPFITNDEERLLHLTQDNESYYTFHSPDTSFLQPSLGSLLKVETEEYGTSTGKFAECLHEAKHKIFSDRHYNFAILIGSVIARAYQPSTENNQGAAGTIGQGIGSIVGGAIGGALGGGAGMSLGSSLGGLLGSLVGFFVSGLNDAELHSLNKGARAIVWLTESEKILQLFNLASEFYQYQYQYQAVGNYFAYKPKVDDNNKVYKLKTWKYLSPETTTIATSKESLLFNNWERESSVFIETDRSIPNPSVVDDSRNSRTQLWGQDVSKFKFMISSYYVSVKNQLRNQYGTIFSVRYISTSGKNYKVNEQPLVFGGDSFINEFTYKRKLRFFTATTFNQVDGSDIYYEDLSNVGYTKYFFNTRNTDGANIDLLNFKSPEGLFARLVLNFGADTIADVINSTFTTESRSMAWMSWYGGMFSGNGNERESSKALASFNEFLQSQFLNPFRFLKPPKAEFDVIEGVDDTKLILQPVKGRIYLYSIGIVSSICESDINVDYRHAEDSGTKDFYPHQSNLDVWLQNSLTIPFSADNFYFYNLDYSKQPTEQSLIVNDIDFKPYQECQNSHPNRIIYSLQDTEIENNDFRDNWLVNRALDYYDFELLLGKLRGINQIENDKVLVRFEHGLRLYAAYNTIQVEADTVQIGNGGLFRSKPITFSHSDLGYLGSQHRAFLSTKFGHIMVDALRGCVFIIGANGSVTGEIAMKKMKSWFLENLPFQINKHFPNIDIDNPFNGIGVHLGYDSNLERLLITKLDYVPLVKGLSYVNNKFLHNGKEVDINDARYFKNISWTISYDFLLETWRSFHSYLPTAYISGNGEFSSVFKNSIWIHNQTNKFYQNFYGVQYPFIIDGFIKPNTISTLLKSVSFNTESRQYSNDFDFRNVNTTFEEAIIYNRNQTSGKLKFNEINIDNLFDRLQYPKIQPDYIDVLLDNAEEDKIFNQFSDVKKNNLPIWLQNKQGTVKLLNSDSVDYNMININSTRLKSQTHYVHFSNHTNYKHQIILKYIKLIHDGGVRRS